MKRARCGTVRGYFDHRAAGELTCAECRAAKNAYQDARRVDYGTCAIHECGKPAHAIGLCSLHQSRHYRHGDASHEGPTQDERFWAKVREGAVPTYAPHLGECWIWSGSVSTQGYGKFSNPSLLAHRVSYESMVGPIPEGLAIDHLCRVRTCVNPAHLDPVTAAENTRRENIARKAAA